jgi:hypothetical protein
MIPLSPELFFYSYIVSPLLSPSNPFAWIPLPSSFDIMSDKRKRDNICLQRRMYSIVNALQVLRKDIIDDFIEESHSKKTYHLKMVIAAMDASTHEKALDIISPWLYTEKHSKKPVSTLRIRNVPGSIIKSICRSIGVDGVPNIPIIRRLNIGDLNKYCQKLSEGDQFIKRKGIERLKHNELEIACFERFITIDGKNTNVLKKELSQWLDLSSHAIDSVDGKYLNPYNRKLALLSLNAVRDFKNMNRDAAMNKLLLQ